MEARFRNVHNIVFPKYKISNFVPELFFHSENARYYDWERFLKFSGLVSFDTYFNAFPVKKYMENCLPLDFSFCLRASGYFIIRMYAVYSDSKLRFHKKKYAEWNFSSPVKIKTKLEIPAESVENADFLYFEVEGEGKIYHGYYGMKNKFENDIKLGIVICTYRREDEVIKTISTIKDHIRNNGNLSEKNVRIYLIDNARTLVSKCRIDDKYLSRLPNPNTGGSGGFEKGLHAAVNSEMDFTHILFMDDDIMLDGEVLHRLFLLLTTMKNELGRNAIAGTMLKMSDRFTVHEAGAVWNGKQIHGIGNGIDMRKTENVFKSLYFPKGNYGGWWFFCFPANWAKKYGYPMQFFIKIDDIEYSLRCAKNILTMNGLAVWHDDFENKYDGYQEYYIKRNELILSSVNKQKPHTLFQIRKLVVNIIKQLAFQRYFLADLVLRAYEDYLLGWKAFNSVNPEKLNRELIKFCPKMIDENNFKVKYNTKLDFNKFDHSIKEKQNLFIQALTFNGYILPERFYIKDEENFWVADMVNCRPVNFYRHKRVFHYNWQTQKGYMTEKSKKEFWRIVKKTIAVSIKFLFNYKKIRRGYYNNRKKLMEYKYGDEFEKRLDE